MHQIAPFLKKFSGEHAPEPPSKYVALPRVACMVLCAMQIPPLLQKYFDPPPPRNEILDTPLPTELSISLALAPSRIQPVLISFIQ